jgi:hypothetical protein
MHVFKKVNVIKTIPKGKLNYSPCLFSPDGPTRCFQRKDTGLFSCSLQGKEKEDLAQIHQLLGGKRKHCGRKGLLGIPVRLGHKSADKGNEAPLISTHFF